MTKSKLYSCKCGGWKFYVGYSTAICVVCNKKQPYEVAGNTIFIPEEPPPIESVVILSDTD